MGVIEPCFQHVEVLFGDPHFDGSPNHGCIGQRREIHFVAVVTVDGDTAVVFMGIIFHDAVLFHQIVVGEIRTHPRLHHHAGRNFDDPVDGRDKIPHVLIVFQEDFSLVACRLCDECDIVLIAQRPCLHFDTSLPAGANDFHGHNTKTAFSQKQIVRFINQLFGGHGLGLYGNRHQKGCSQKKATDFK